MSTIREILFRGFSPCTNGDCIVSKPERIHTNGSCKCLLNLSRSQLMILQSRLSTIIDKEVKQ